MSEWWKNFLHTLHYIFIPPKYDEWDMGDGCTGDPAIDNPYHE